MNKKNKYIYTITLIQESSKKASHNRCMGWFTNLKEARDAVLSNAGDMFEVGYYKYAVIERCEMGIYCHIDKEYWFEAHYLEGGDALRPLVAEIEMPPKEYEGVCNFGIG